MVHEEATNTIEDGQIDTIAQVEARIATGFSRKKIAFLAGMDDEAFDRVMKGGTVSTGYGLDCLNDRRTIEAIAALQAWLDSETKGSPDDTG